MGREGSGGGCIINAGVRGRSTSHGILVIFFFLANMGCPNKQKAPGLLGFLCVVQRLTSDPGSGSTTHPGC